ncbi:MAG: ATP-binding cassette domain-containing protein [Synergistaceae bacterium]|jgi:D-methionine transport system ATP-binding protein|nr:ATP-binding cassette domain-containing protein [Synergistaceae bacterium]
MIELKNINKTYQTSAGTLKALDNVSVNIGAGKAFGFIGLSGAGKSTLLRCVNLLERPDSGKVLVDGEDMMSLPHAALLRRRRKIGMIFQHYNLLANCTVFDNVAFPLSVSHTPKARIKERVEQSLDIVSLSERAGDYPAKLSGGQKQRVAIARAISMDPKILLCDEPTSALDPHTTTVILQYIKRVNSELGITVVLVTHEMEAARAICDVVSVMEHGKLVETIDMSDKSFLPQSDIARHLFCNGAGI